MDHLMMFLKRYAEQIKQNFTIIDMGLLKVIGALFGILLGLFFPEFFRSFLVPIVLLMAILAGHFILLITFKNN